MPQIAFAQAPYHSLSSNKSAHRTNLCEEGFKGPAGLRTSMIGVKDDDSVFL
jgi:hypothetical protein